MSYPARLVQLVREIVTQVVGPPPIAHGTIAERTNATSALVEFSGSAGAIPVVVPGDLVANAGDRVGLVRFGSDWTVVVAYPEHV